MRGFIFISFLWLPFPVFGGNDFAARNGASIALGHHSTTLTDAFSIYNNPASAAFLDGAALGVSYHSSFWPAAITDAVLTGSGPVGFGTVGGSVSYLGNDLYYEMKVGVAYAVKLAGKAGIGIQLDYLHSKAGHYSGKHFATFEIGLFYQPIESVRVGAHVYNPVRYKADKFTDEILPVVMQIGLQYLPHEKVQLFAELEKDIDHPFSFSSAISYTIIPALKVRGGFRTSPTTLTFGLGYQLKTFVILDVSSSYHFILGFNTAVSLSLLLQRKPHHED